MGVRVLTFPADRVVNAPRRTTRRDDVTLDGAPDLDGHRDCVVTYQIGPTVCLLVSYDTSGEIYEEFRTTTAGGGQDEVDRLLTRMRFAGTLDLVR